MPINKQHGGDAKERYLRAIAAGLRSRAKGRGEVVVLDAATGAGNTLVSVARVLRPNQKLISVDHRAAAQAVARRKFAGVEKWARPVFVVDDLRSLRAIRSESVDVVCSDGTINCLGHDYLAALIAMRRVLKPGGVLFIRDVLSPETLPGSERAEYWRHVMAASCLLPGHTYDMVPAEAIRTAVAAIGFGRVRTFMDSCKPRKPTQHELERGDFKAESMFQLNALPPDLREPFLRRVGGLLQEMKKRGGPIWASYFIRAVKV